MTDPTVSTPADRWWFTRGAQSAFYFYLSCGPCNNVRGEKRRRKAAQRSKQEKEMMRAENPGVYYHPAPFEMNPHWDEEMRLGPGPPPRRARKGTRESRESRGGATTADDSIASSLTDFSRLGEVAKSGPLEAGSGAPGGWNIKRYHRADEEFIETVAEENAAQVTSAHGIVLDTNGATVRKPERSYNTHRAPPINDMHPPVVSLLPTAWQDRQWMKAPPPSKEFMEGKKGVTALSRGSSAASRPTIASVSHWLGGHDTQPQIVSESDMYDFSTTKGTAQNMTDTDELHTPKRYSVRRQRSRRHRAHADSISSAGSDSSGSDAETPNHPIALPQPTHIRANRTARMPRSPKHGSTTPLQDVPVNPLLLSPNLSPSKGKGKARSPARKSASPSKQTLPPQDSMEALDSGDSFSIKDARVSRRRSAKLIDNGRGIVHDDEDDGESRDAFHWMKYRQTDLENQELRTVPLTGERWSTEF